MRPLFGFRTCVAAALFGLVAGAVLPLTAQNQEEEDLYSYAMEGVLEEVERLLEEGVSPDAAGESGSTALMFAA